MTKDAKEPCVKCGEYKLWGLMYAVNSNDKSKGNICYLCKHPKVDYDKIFNRNIAIETKPKMTKEERQLVVEYMKRMPTLYEAYEKNEGIYQDEVILIIQDTLHFRLYALRDAWRKLIDKLKIW